jgi:phage-related protein
MAQQQSPPPKLKKIQVSFFQTKLGKEPVRDWLRGLTKDDRRKVGEDIMTVEVGWPIGMPACRPLGGGLHEVRTTLDNRIARVLFYVDRDLRMVLLHGFIKKTQKTPKQDADLARARKTQHERGHDDEN